MALLAVLAISQPGQCQNSPRLTASQLTALVRSSDSRVTATNVSVVGTGPSVTVLAEKSASASDRDLKIDSIFLAKALIEGSSGQVDKVKVLFSQADKPGRFVLVDKKVVDDYAGGKMTPEQLLSSITLTPLEQEKAPDVAEGPLMERRLLIWRRIERLRSQGTGVATFQQLFQKVEKGLNTESPEAMIQNLSFIETKLSEQEGLLKQAKRLTRGIPRTESKGGASTTSQPVASTPLPPPQNQQQPPHNQGGGGNTASRPTNIPWGQGGGQQGGFPPPPPFGPPGGGFPPPP